MRSLSSAIASAIPPGEGAHRQVFVDRQARENAPPFRHMQHAHSGDLVGRDVA